MIETDVNTRQIAVHSQTLVQQSIQKQCNAARLYPQPHPIHCRKITTNIGRNTETIINLLFSSGSIAAMLTNYELYKNKKKIKRGGNYKNHPTKTKTK